MFGFGRKHPKPNASDPPPRWRNAEPLLAPSPNDRWTIGDSFEGVQIFGATGSGKTSGSGAAIARAMLQAGYGGLALTVKPDEADLWRRYCDQTGRAESLVMFGPGHGKSFNFLEYERRRGEGGGRTENIAELLLDVRRATRKGASAGGQDPFWEEALQALLRNTIDLLLLADEQLSLPVMDRLIRSAPHAPETMDDAHALDASYCASCVRTAHARLGGAPANDPRRATLEATAAYWGDTFPKIPHKTRESVFAMFTNLADGFLRGDMRELFCGPTNLVPELTLEGAVIVLDLPLKRYQDLGRAAQIIWKYLWQRAVEARDVRRNPRPVFLWADEAQNFFTAQDMKFQPTARSSRAATVYLTQNISNYYASIGGLSGGDARSTTDAFLGNLQTVIFHANADSVTNKWAQEYFAERWNWRGGTSRGGKPGEEHNSASFQSYRDPTVLASAFHGLRRGGPRDRGVVEAIVAHGGRHWRATGQPAIKCRFHQSDAPRDGRRS